MVIALKEITTALKHIDNILLVWI